MPRTDDSSRTVAHLPIEPEPKQASRSVGPYKLLQRIGEGGMGEVWMADQQHPIRRRVAVKLIKPGHHTKQVIARFEAERQALAMMESQHIAKVLDAGVTDDGQPYFVMELVPGVPITDYCDRNRLTVEERLRLFVSVCHAVQHAHHKGIIHRDLKPSNVLVTLYDGRPVPKVIDFGLAKALQHQTQLTDKTLFTEFNQVVGTVQYMSPEQAELNALNVDTRTDVYSLGVMLYELLAGSTPLDKATAKEQVIFKVLEIIREKDPPRPSDRLSASADAMAGISQQRRTEPDKLQRHLRGELDSIVMKAIEKDRSRRYATPDALAQDVERFLNDEPVAARPPTLAYRLQKVWRKHRAAVLTYIVIVLSLVAGIVGTSWQAWRAKRSAYSAELARQEQTQANDSLKLQIVKTLELLRETASSEMKLGNFNKANNYFDEAVALLTAGVPVDPMVAWQVKLDAAGVKLSINRAEEALTLLSSIDVPEATDSAALEKQRERLILNCLMATGDFAKAKTLVDKLLQGETPPQLKDYLLVQRARCLTNLQEHEEALRVLEEVMSRQIGNGAVMYLVVKQVIDSAIQANRWTEFSPRLTDWAANDLAMVAFEGHAFQVPIRCTIISELIQRGRLEIASEMSREVIRRQVLSSGGAYPTVLQGLKQLEADGPNISEGKHGVWRFNGRDSFGLAPNLQFDGVAPWTIEVIVTPRSTADGAVVSTTEAGSFTIEVNSTRWTFWLSGDEYQIARARSSVRPNQPQHVAGVWTGGKIWLFVDGVLEDAVDIEEKEVPFALSGLPVTLGADASPDNLAEAPFFGGDIHGCRLSKAIEYDIPDDLKVGDRAFDPPEELQVTPHTVALFDPRYREGDLAVDPSGNGHHAIIVNTEWIEQDE